jgi:hypothetical protein
VRPRFAEPGAPAPRLPPLRGAALLAIALVACKRGEHGIERDIRAGLAAQLGMPVSAVTCDRGTPPRACQARVDDQWLPVAVAAAPDGSLGWTLDGLVIAAAPLEQRVIAELDSLGIAAPVRCGPRLRVAHAGDRIACALGAPASPVGTAWATLTGDDGSYALEIALGADAVHARSDDVDVAALDELSAALDLDPGSDEAGGDHAEAGGGDHDERAPAAGAAGKALE